MTLTVFLNINFIKYVVCEMRDQGLIMSFCVAVNASMSKGRLPVPVLL
jgi:hypothetical protein